MGEALDQVDDGVGPAGFELVEQLVGDALDRRLERGDPRRGEGPGDEAPQPRVVGRIDGQHVAGEGGAGKPVVDDVGVLRRARRPCPWRAGCPCSAWRAASWPSDQPRVVPVGQPHLVHRARRLASTRTAGTGRSGRPWSQSPQADGRFRHRACSLQKPEHSSDMRWMRPVGAGVGVDVLLDDHRLVAEARPAHVQPPAQLEPGADLADGGVDDLVLVDVAEPPLERGADLGGALPLAEAPGSSADSEASASSASASRSKSWAASASRNDPGDGELRGGGRRCAGGVHASVVRRGTPSSASGSYPIFGSGRERFDQTVLHREQRRLGAGGHAELRVDVLEVRRHRLAADRQLGRRSAGSSDPRASSTSTSTSRRVRPAGSAARRPHPVAGRGQHRVDGVAVESSVLHLLAHRRRPRRRRRRPVGAGGARAARGTRRRPPGAAPGMEIDAAGQPVRIAAAVEALVVLRRAGDDRAPAAGRGRTSAR